MVNATVSFVLRLDVVIAIVGTVIALAALVLALLERRGRRRRKSNRT